jgi:hypothetical protein
MLVVLLILAGPPFFVGGLVGAAVARARGGPAIAVAAGLGLALGLLLLAWATGGLSNANCGSSECFQEPQFTLFVLGIGFVGWLIGVVVGAGIRGGWGSVSPDDWD